MSHEVSNNETEPRTGESLSLYHESQADGVPYMDHDDEEQFIPTSSVESDKPLSPTK